MLSRQLLIRVKEKALSQFLGFVILLAVVFFVFSPLLTASFVNWDDPVHLLENPFVQSLSWHHLVRIFSTTVNHIYIPLTTLSFAVEYHFCGFNPFIYHLDNLLLHLGMTAMIYLFALRCGLSTLGAFIAALLFGIHPLHVESVAWITERKDVLSGFLYMLALFYYSLFVEWHKKRLLVMATIFGILSMLAKPMAISLPLVFLLYDWFKGRAITPILLKEKMVLIVAVCAMGMATYALQTPVTIHNIFNSLLLWIWCFVFYLQKFIFPWPQVLLYHFPTPINIGTMAYGGSLVVFFMLLWSLIVFRKYRWYLFAFLFYIGTIFFLLRFDTQLEFDVVADRFMYIPSIGFCLFFGFLWERFYIHWRYNKAIFLLGGICVISLFLVFGFQARQQSYVWKDSIALWENQLRYYPEVATAKMLYGLAQAYMAERPWLTDTKAKKHIVRLYQKAITIKPDFAEAYLGLAQVYCIERDFKKAKKAYLTAVSLKPSLKWAKGARCFQGE